MLYWVTDSFGQLDALLLGGARTTRGSPSHDRTPVVEAPTAIALLPQELMLMPRRADEELLQPAAADADAPGGHFHPMEEPELLVEDIRAFFRTLR